MHKSKLKLKEVLFVMLPLVIPASIAVALPGKPGATVGLPGSKLRVIVKDVQFEPVTPLEVYEGYDTKVIVTFDTTGNKPSWPNSKLKCYANVNNVRLVYEKDGKPQLLKIPGRRGMTIDPATDAAQRRVRFLLPLAQLPVTPGPLTLRADLGATLGTVPTAGGPYTLRMRVPPVPLSVVVRKAGEQIKVPDVSRDPLLSVAKVQVLPVPPAQRGRGSSAITYDTVVKVELQYRAPPGLRGKAEPKWNFVDNSLTCLIDERGHKHTDLRMTGQDSKGHAFDVSVGIGMTAPTREHRGEVDKHRYAIEFHIPLFGVPESAGEVRLKSLVSVNDAWPMWISVVVRERGKTAAGKPPRRSAL